MVYVHLIEGFEEIEAVAIMDLLRRADIPVRTISLMKDLTVTGSHGIPVVADFLFEETSYDECDMFVLPGGPGVNRLMEHVELNNALVEFAQTGKWIAAICAAPKILGAKGLLDGKNATIYRGMENELGKANYRKEKVVQDGQFITSMGPGTAIPFALKLIEVIAGKGVSDKINDSILIDYC
jgi:4-methyl-5(b-hydroxyethyl)-thiazole monophosphate biosynthesis